MRVSALVAVAFLSAAVFLAVHRPDGWSNEARVGLAIESVLAAVLVLDLAVIWRLSNGDRHMSMRERIITVGVALLVCGGAVAVGVLLPLSLPGWTRWLCVAVSVVAATVVVY